MLKPGVRTTETGARWLAIDLYPCAFETEYPMAMPPSSHPCWSRAANGGLARIRTTNLAMQLLVKRLERSTDPAPRKVAEIQAFFTKWERILPAEIDQLNRI